MNLFLAPRSSVTLVALMLACLTWARATSAAPVKTDYIALGDSLAFGETDFQHNPSDGDRGYAKLFDNFLASQGPGKPHLINLALDGETSSTFFNNSAQGDGTPGNPSPQWNTNYPSPPVSQNALLLSTIAGEQAAGHVIGTISVQLGANNLYQLVTNPAFFALSPTEQQAQIAGALGTVQTNYTALLSELHSQVPNAHVLLMGYYNPFNGAPGSPLASVADPAIKALNAVIAGEAAAFGAGYVDTYAAIAGNELKDTYIASGNVHPNEKGYHAITDQMATTATTVPEPSSLLIMGAGVAGWAALAYRRRWAL